MIKIKKFSFVLISQRIKALNKKIAQARLKAKVKQLQKLRKQRLKLEAQARLHKLKVKELARIKKARKHLVRGRAVKFAKVGSYIAQVDRNMRRDKLF